MNALAEGADGITTLTLWAAMIGFLTVVYGAYYVTTIWDDPRTVRDVWNGRQRRGKGGRHR